MVEKLNYLENRERKIAVPFNKSLVSESENFIEERFSNKVALLDYVSSINEKHEVYEGLLLLQNEEFVKLLDDRDIKAVVKFIAKENKWISATEANEPQPRAVAVPMTAVAFFFVAVVGAVYLAGAAKTVTKTINFSGLDKFYSPIFLPETEIVLRAIAEYAGGEFATKVDKYIIKIATEDIKERYYCNTSENILAF